MDAEIVGDEGPGHPPGLIGAHPVEQLGGEGCDVSAGRPRTVGAAPTREVPPKSLACAEPLETTRITRSKKSSYRRRNAASSPRRRPVNAAARGVRQADDGPPARHARLGKPTTANHHSASVRPSLAAAGAITPCRPSVTVNDRSGPTSSERIPTPAEVGHAVGASECSMTGGWRGPRGTARARRATRVRGSCPRRALRAPRRRAVWATLVRGLAAAAPTALGAGGGRRAVARRARATTFGSGRRPLAGRGAGGRRGRSSRRAARVPS